MVWTFSTKERLQQVTAQMQEKIVRPSATQPDFLPDRRGPKISTLDSYAYPNLKWPNDIPPQLLQMMSEF